MKIKDEFLSKEDLDIRNLTDEELYTYWDLWLELAQATNMTQSKQSYPQKQIPSS